MKSSKQLHYRQWSFKKKIFECTGYFGWERLTQTWSLGYIFISSFWPFYTTISTPGPQRVQTAFTLLDLQLLAYWRYEELRSNFIYCCCHCWHFPALQDICCDRREPPSLKEICLKSPNCWRNAVAQCACVGFCISKSLFSICFSISYLFFNCSLNSPCILAGIEKNPSTQPVTRRKTHMAWGNHMVIMSIYSFLHFWGEKM